MMLLDLLDSQNYVMVNRDAIRILGVTTAIYCSELLIICKKARNKNKLFEDKYFKVDRNYVKKSTSIEIEEQLKCDLNLKKVSIIEVNENNPDLIYFNDEIYASILSSQDVKLLDSISKKVKVENPKNLKKTKEERLIIALKEGIDCRTPEVLQALRNWIDSIYSSGKGISKQQIAIFKDKIDEYCNGDLEKALKIIEIATVHNYIDCQWAINIYENKNRPIYTSAPRVTNSMRVTQQRVSSGLGTEEF